MHVNVCIQNIVNTCTGILKKICSGDMGNGCIQWNTHIIYIERKRYENVWLDRVIEPCITSKVAHSTTELSRPIKSMVILGQTTTFLPLQSFCPLRNAQQTHLHPDRTYWFNTCLIRDGHTTTCNRKERKYRIKQFFSIEEGKCVNVWKIMNWIIKNNTNHFPHLGWVHHIPNT